jgi:hypothetical protein
MHRQPEGELHHVLAGEWRTAPVVEHCRKLFLPHPEDLEVSGTNSRSVGQVRGTESGIT